MVRPGLEYAAELWTAEIPAVLANKAEAVQTDFARAISAQHALTLVSMDSHFPGYPGHAREAARSTHEFQFTPKPFANVV